MNKQFLRFTFFLLLYLALPLTAAAQIVNIPDPNLRAAVENALGKTAGAPITVSDMAKLTRLDAKNANISDLTGLESATNLTELFLGDEYVEAEDRWLNSNSVKDLSPLAGLTSLIRLGLRKNNISDISAVAGLTNLILLDLNNNNISDISALEGLTNLTWLNLWYNTISDISALEGLTSLKALSLGGNTISDISMLAGLTQLERLELWGNNTTDISSVAGLTNLTSLGLNDNNISDISPLVANAGLGNGDTVDVKGNRLSDQSFYTHIPVLQNRGVTVEFDNRLPLPPINTNGIVRLVYFLPSDRPARPDRVVALRQLIKDAQRYFAGEMHRHGFGRKTITIETDADGEPLVHQVNGKFKEEYYYKNLTDFAVWEEIQEHFDANDLQQVYFIAIDLSSERLNAGETCGLGGINFYSTQGDIGFVPAGEVQSRSRYLTQGAETFGGFALIPASGACFERLGITAHELGHAFGLGHDYREGPDSDYLMNVAKQRSPLSNCAAEWLSVNRFFNTKSIFHNEPGEIQLLELQPYSQDAISFRFKVTDPDGLHQAQLLVPSIIKGTGWGTYRLFDCKRLNGKTSTVESLVRTAELVDRIALQIIDVGGNITWATLPIQLDEIMPAQNALDVNSDGVVNILDLTPIASRFGQRGKDPVDVNEDGVVDVVDLLIVAAPISSLSRQAVEMFTMAEVQKWLTDAKQLEVENETLKKGIVFLEHLLAEITLLSKPMETTTSQPKATFGHTDIVWSVAFSPDGQTLASASADNLVRLWNVETEQLLYAFIGHTYHVNSVAFSPDGQTLASASRDQTVRLWNPNTGKPKRTLTDYVYGVKSVAFSPDGQTLASGGTNQPIRLWNTTTWQVERTLTGHTGDVEYVAFSPDGLTLASASRDDTIRLWNPNTGQLLHMLTGHTSDVKRLAFSSNGNTLASGDTNGTVILWNPQTGASKNTLTAPAGWHESVAFSPDGKTLAIGNRGISLWDTETGQYKEPLTEDIGNAISLVFSPDGTTLASGSGDGKVRLWDFTPTDTSADNINGDINSDGVVNVLDLVVIASKLGNQGQNLATDVNRDGVVSILDLILVAGMFDGAAAAPSAQPQVPETLTAVEVQGWLTDARALEIKDPIMKRGIIMLEQLLITLTPKETELLANYPNPFNPETWIPYRLAEDAFVTLTIYNGNGQVVRTLDVGHRIASAYESQSKAIYWNGRNDVGERVASGVYFYTLRAGGYNATRKMLILK